jgi:hypothetical protein
VKYVVVMTIENGTLLVSGVSVMIRVVLEESVLKYVVENSYDIVEDVNCCCLDD